MGQTLTHGVYLPDEGERNCYSGLAANWQLLDGAVGTVAEHTTQIAGKAPAVHTHTKADITDFPAYGNAAGTICEGNDSRLSDARTPVAHTHGKADITDLFNSVNTWTASQYLKNTAITDYKANPSADTNIGWTFRSNENKYWGGITHNYFTTGVSEVQIAMSNWKTSGSQGFWHLDFGATKDFSNVYFQPSSNNNVNLGSSSNQWKSVYAQSYYYDGVAWGLDKANVWTGNNTFTSTITTKTNVDRTVAPASDATYGTIICRDKNGSAIFRMQGTIKTDLSNVWDMMMVAPNASYITFFKYTISSSSSDRELRLKATSIVPDDNSTADLGTSTNKWKSLNGINPGALSIFNPSATYDPIDIPSTWNTSGTSWNALNVSNLGDGWICITYNNCSAGDYILARFGGTNGARYPSLRFEAVKESDNKYYIYALFPVAKAFSNIYLEMLINSNANLVLHHYIPAYGTV